MDPYQFKAVLLEISNQLTEDQLNKAKFLCQDDIGKRSMETIDSGTKLFTALSERGKLGPANTELLGRMLQQIRRDDLCQILDAFVTGSSLCHQDDTENGTVEQSLAPGPGGPGPGGPSPWPPGDSLMLRLCGSIKLNLMNTINEIKMILIL